MYLTLLFPALLFPTTIGDELPHPSKLMSRIIPTPEYLQPLQSSQLEVKVFEDGDFLDLSAASVEWIDPWNMFDFSDQEGTTIRATPSVYDGLNLEMRSITAMVTLDDITYNVTRYIKIFRPWGEEYKPDISTDIAPIPSEFYPDTYNRSGGCPQWPDVYFADERWNQNGHWILPSYDEAVWKPDVPGELKTVVYSREEEFQWSISLQLTYWDRSQANLYCEYYYDMTSFLCNNEINYRKQIDHPAWRRCGNNDAITTGAIGMLSVTNLINYNEGHYVAMTGRANINGVLTNTYWEFNADPSTPRPTRVPTDPTCLGTPEE